MNTGESKRPSLITGSPVKPSEASSSARILADMEGLPSLHQKKKKRRRALRPILLFGLLVCTGAAGWMLLTHGAGSTDDGASDLANKDMPAIEHMAPTMPSSSMTELDRPAASVVSSSDGDTAVIVDDVAADQGSDNALANIGIAPLSPLPTATPIETRATAGTPMPAPAASQRAGESRSAQRPPAGIASRSSVAERAVARKRQQPGEPDLMATLMANIGGARETASAASGGAQRRATTASPSAMDELVDNIRGNRDTNYTASATALGTIASGSDADRGAPAARQVARSVDVQSELSNCPRANTLQGIECRKRVCSKYAGRDGACPK